MGRCRRNFKLRLTRRLRREPQAFVTDRRGMQCSRQVHRATPMKPVLRVGTKHACVLTGSDWVEGQ